jgi:hypothetical protein
MTGRAPEHPALSFSTNAALVALAYPGDTTGNKGYSSPDASRVQRVIVELDSGFDAFDTFAPNPITDTTGNRNLSSLDAANIQQMATGLPVDSFPIIPPSSSPFQP